MAIEMEIIAFIASLLGTFASLPQIYKIIKTNDTQALSYQNYILVLCSSFVWIFYGYIAPVYSIMLWNSIFALLSLTVIFLKFFNERNFKSELKESFD